MYMCMFLGSENQWHCKTDVYWRKENKLLGGLLLESTIPAPSCSQLTFLNFSLGSSNLEKNFKLKMLRYERMIELLLNQLISGLLVSVEVMSFFFGTLKLNGFLASDQDTQRNLLYNMYIHICLKVWTKLKFVKSSMVVCNWLRVIMAWVL